MTSNSAIIRRVDELYSLKYEPQKLQEKIKSTFVEHQANPDFILMVTNGLYRSGEFTIAGHMANMLCKLYPRYAPAYGLLSSVLMLFGRAQEASALCQRAMAFGSHDQLSLHKKNALYVYYFGDPSRPEVRLAQEAVGKTCFPSPESFISTEKINKDPARKLRIGYVSTDLRDNHPVYRFMEGVLSEHDTSAFDVHTYNLFEDAEAFQSLPLPANVIKRNLFGLSVEQCAKTIKKDRIDVLIDLNGHSGDTSGELFHHRVAPVQITYLGYPGTSGLANMDCRIGDAFADLPDFEAQNSETVLRMPNALWHYRPWPDMPKERAESAFVRNGYITFGSANNHAKLQHEWLEVWAKVLARVPNSRLFMKSRVLENQDVVASVTSIFEKQGVEASRLELKHFSHSRAEHWQDLQKIDIALDAYPYNGTTTTCDLLWLGVPVLSRSGNAHVARTTGSILNELGMEDWTCTSDEAFIEAAISKSSDLAALGDLHTNLNKRFRETSLGDIERYMPNYEAILREAWTKYCTEELRPSKTKSARESERH